MEGKNKSYSRQKHRMAVTGLLLPPFILFFFLFIGLPAFFKDITASLSPNIYLNLIIFSMLIGAACYIVNLPFNYYSGFILEHRFSLSNQTLKDWFKRELKKIILSFIITLPIILPVYAFIRYWPLHWWLLTAILWFTASVILAKFAPLLIVPLFYKYSPIKNSVLKDKLIKLAMKAGFTPEGVYEIDMSRDTRKANAAVIGLGKQKRIVLCDTLLQNFTEPEIESVMGHELGHHKKQHSLKLVLFSGVSIVTSLFVANILFLRLHSIFFHSQLLYDFESLMLIYAVISTLNIVGTPIHNAFSRKLERDADRFALEITGNKEAFVSAMKKLASQNLADTTPGKFYELILYSHPPISRRISFAESFGNKK